MYKKWYGVAASCAVLLLTACGAPWNDPYPADGGGTSNTLYAAFAERPKHLDPVQSYSSNEIVFTAQIYTPPLQYHYLKRPYTLIPFAAETVPQPVFLDSNQRVLEADANPAKIAYSLYEIKIRPGLKYQPHPAFAKDESGNALYLALTDKDIRGVFELRDFAQSGSREVLAEDFVYEIKRLAHPKLHSPILGLMSEYIVGLKEFAEQLKQAHEANIKQGKSDEWLDLRQFPLEGVEVVDAHTYRVRLKGKYPQFVYWLAMPFFAPIPHEADKFYSQRGLAEKNITLDWYPIGAGPYMLTKNNPNRQMVLERNPNFFGETFPSEGAEDDAKDGSLNDAGRAIPMIDRAVFSLEKEQIPYWNKFLQGYYDASGITSDTFDQAVQIGNTGQVTLTEEMVQKGIQLKTGVQPSSYYVGFNMLDPLIGGDSDRARKLRQAVSIAVDYEEFVSIFQNGRGIPAQGPLPPGIYGYREGEAGINRYVYEWVNGQPQRKPIQAALKLMEEAGYANGVDRETNQPLSLNFDVTARGPDDKARMDWMRKQLAKINVNLIVRATDYNRFQEKMRKGDAQIYMWGWNADYPDPENFFFLLHGPQGKVKFQGENASNYSNPEYDKLFERMKNMENGAEREQIIHEMEDVLRRDAPWLWGFHPKDYGLSHSWVKNRKPNQIANNTLKYQRVDPVERATLRAQWNRPALWPIAVIALVLALFAWLAYMTYRRRERGTAREEQLSAAEMV